MREILLGRLLLLGEGRTPPKTARPAAPAANISRRSMVFLLSEEMRTRDQIQFWGFYITTDLLKLGVLTNATEAFREVRC